MLVNAAEAERPNVLGPNEMVMVIDCFRSTAHLCAIRIC